MTVDDLVVYRRARMMSNQLLSISLSDDVSVSHWSFLNGFIAARLTLSVSLLALQGQLQLGEQRVRLASSNIVASNGIIHMIDGLLYPPSILPILPHRCDLTESKITQVRGRRLFWSRPLSKRATVLFLNWLENRSKLFIYSGNLFCLAFIKIQNMASKEFIKLFRPHFLYIKANV